MDREKLITDNLKLVYYVVGKILNNHSYLEYEDLIAEGYVALCKAANNYKQHDKTKFSTFAICVIKNHLINYLKLNTKHSLKEIDHNEEHLIRISDSLPLSDEKLYHKEIKSILQQVFKKLTPEQKKVIVMSFYHNKSLRDIAKCLKKSHEKIRQIQKEAMAVMRESIYIKP